MSSSQVEAGLQHQNGSLNPVPQEPKISSLPQEKTYSEWSTMEKRIIISFASGAAIFSPLSANIYYPAFNILADELNVSNTLINITVTSYMIFQGLAPAFIGGISDGGGRRPAYMLCFVLYIAANIGLAVQHQYVALLLLRCLQSAGSSSTVSLANAVVADVATSSERGQYVGFAQAGAFIGPSVGPIIGGLLVHFLGWPAIFWFLTIFSGAFFLFLLISFPETCRKIVDDGSIFPAKWNMSLTTYFHQQRYGRSIREISAAEAQRLRSQSKIRFPNPLKILGMIFEKEVGLVLVVNSISFAAFYAVAGAIPSQFAEIYQFNDIKIGLCFIPVGVGSLLAAFPQGRVVDWNYRRWARRLGFPLQKTKQTDLTNFPIERARLELALPLLLIEAASIITFGWVTDYETNLAGPLILLLVIAFSSCASYNAMSILIVDVYPESPALAGAATNLTRCWLGAGITAAIIPMIEAMGRGWSFVIIGLSCVVASPILLVLIKYGPVWRSTRHDIELAKLNKKMGKKSYDSMASTESKVRLNKGTERISSESMQTTMIKMEPRPG